MGTRINVLMDHNIADYEDQSAVLARLTPALPATLAVRDYWNINDPFPKRELQEEWLADLYMLYETNWRSYTAPGSLFLKVGPHSAKLRTGGRWRGFVSIPPLYQVHLQAFRAVAHALGATQFACFPDCDDVYNAFYERGTFDEGIAILKGYMSLPQPSIDEIAPEIAAEADHTVPGVWYYEKSEKLTHDKPFSAVTR